MANLSKDTEIYAKFQELEIRQDKACTILAQTLFNASILKQIPSKAGLLKKFVVGEKDRKAFLGGLERLIGLTHPELLASTPLILKGFYDLNVLPEEAILKWAEKVSKKFVDKKVAKQIHEKAQPFVNWLKEAEEESSDEEEDD